MKNASVSSASLRDENSSRTSRTLREIKTTTYIWDDWNTNGEIVAHYDYSPFGEPLVASGPLTAMFTHQFSTKPYCPITGFSEYQMRKYRPEIGRWMSRDPIDENGGANLYSLCNNCLVMWFDNLGLSGEAALLRCRELAQKINRREHTGVPPIDGLIDLAVEYKCKSWHIECKVCEESCSGEGEARRTFLIGEGCVSHICVTAKDSPSLVETILIHEMTHCLQFCRKIPTLGCEACLCNELQSYHAENPRVPDSLLVRRAKQSCTKGNFPPCYSERQMWHFLKKPGFITICKQSGNRDLVQDELSPSNHKFCGSGGCRL